MLKSKLLLLGLLLIGAVGCKNGQLFSSSTNAESKANSQYPENTNDSTNSYLPENTNDSTNSQLPENTGTSSGNSQLPGNTDDPTGSQARNAPKSARYVLKQDPAKRKIDILMVLNNAPSSIDSKLAEEREKRAEHFKDVLTNNLQLTDWQMAFTSFGQVTQETITRNETRTRTVQTPTTGTQTVAVTKTRDKEVCVEWADEDDPRCPRMVCSKYETVTEEYVEHETRTYTYTSSNEVTEEITISETRPKVELNSTNRLYTLMDSSNQPLQATSNMDVFKYTMGLDDPADVKILAPSLTSAYDSTLSDILEKTTTSNQFGHTGFELAGLHKLLNSDHPLSQKATPRCSASCYLYDRSR